MEKSLSCKPKITQMAKNPLPFKNSIVDSSVRKSLTLGLIQDQMNPLHALFQEEPLQYPKAIGLSNPSFSPKTVYFSFPPCLVHCGFILG
jgi:hypothetical protein